jgi:hypothetical protein
MMLPLYKINFVSQLFILVHADVYPSNLHYRVKECINTLVQILLKRFFNLYEGKKLQKREFLLMEMLRVVDQAAWIETACH